MQLIERLEHPDDAQHEVGAASVPLGDPTESLSCTFVEHTTTDVRVKMASEEISKVKAFVRRSGKPVCVSGIVPAAAVLRFDKENRQLTSVPSSSSSSSSAAAIAAYRRQNKGSEMYYP